MVMEHPIIGKNRFHFEEINSTNTWLKENGERLPHGAVVSADHQTAGKGRLGRSWQNGMRDTLMFSILLKGLPLSCLAILPALAGIAVCQGLSSLFGDGFQIKWPNDIVFQKKKLCGILCESRISSAASQQEEPAAFAVCGIGVNLTQPEAFFVQSGLPHATSVLLATGSVPSAQPVLDSILLCFDRCYSLYLEKGFSCLLPEYQRLSATLGNQILIQQDGVSLSGLAQSLGPAGELICMIDGKQAAFCSGEVSVRGLYGYL